MKKAACALLIYFGLVVAYASTYYLYDDFGNLVVVIPPEGVNRISNQTN